MNKSSIIQDDVDQPAPPAKGVDSKLESTARKPPYSASTLSRAWRLLGGQLSKRSVHYFFRVFILAQPTMRVFNCSWVMIVYLNNCCSQLLLYNINRKSQKLVVISGFSTEKPKPPNNKLIAFGHSLRASATILLNKLSKLSALTALQSTESIQLLLRIFQRNSKVLECDLDAAPAAAAAAATARTEGILFVDVPSLKTGSHLIGNDYRPPPSMESWLLFETKSPILDAYKKQPLSHSTRTPSRPPYQEETILHLFHPEGPATTSLAEQGRDFPGENIAETILCFL